EGLEKYYEKLTKTLTREKLSNKIEAYNEKLKASKIKNKGNLVIDTSVTNNCIWIINLLLIEFTLYMDAVEECYEKRKWSMRTTQPARKGTPIRHQLRWNEAKTNFENFFREQIRNKQILLYPGVDDPDEIFKILNTVFEKVSISNKGNTS